MRDPREHREGAIEPGASPARREAARTTIVGGQPDGNARDLPPIPVALEHLMGLAAASPEFAEALGRNRKAALEATGLELSASERAIFEAVPTPALDQMISRVGGRLDAPDRRRFMEQAALALAALLGASAGAGCKKKPSAGSGDKQGDPPARDQPGAPEGEREPPERARDPDPPPAARPDAAAARPVEATPERPAERPATPEAMDMDADAMDMAGMDLTGRVPPASVAPIRERPDQPPPSKGAQPWRPKPRGVEPAMTRGIRPDRHFKPDDL